MGKDYIPGPDAKAATFFEHFAGNIAAAWSAYALAPAQSASISAVVNQYLEALAVASNEQTRTKATVLVKDQARVNAENLIRLYSGLIKHNAGISDEDKIAIGVPPVNVARTRRDAPSSAPLLKILYALPNEHVLSFNDSTTPNRRAMPFGATYLQLFCAVGDAPASGPSEAQFYGCFTKSRMRVTHDPADAGKVATYYARWGSRRGEFGPWSLPRSMRIAA